MAAYCARNGVFLAPHGKTTMAPALFRRQLADGAWAISAATTWQAQTMWALGIPRVVIANEVVIPAEIRWIARALDPPQFWVTCYVDSPEVVAIMDEALSTLSSSTRLPVLLEMGIEGGRTGARGVERGLDVARAVLRSDSLRLCGTAGFEGIIAASDGRTAAGRVDDHLDDLVALTRAVEAIGAFADADEVIVTAGGSAWFDHVVERLCPLDLAKPWRLVLRSGCYLTHDDGALHQSSPMGAESRTGLAGEQLVPALEIWGAVLSRPEPTRAIVGIGKRDVSHDSGLPVAKWVRRRIDGSRVDLGSMHTVGLNDQHLYLDLGPSDLLDVGDLMGFGVSHPCTTFDKWRVIPIVDDDYCVTEMIDTYF
ncbi:MAG: type III PLP-dependent enzyme domain-containing protein [Acidimicrobiales bacterium]